MPFAVFLNRVACQGEAGETLHDLLRRQAPDLAEAFDAGGVVATDGRGIAVAPETPLYPGAIFLVRRSARAATDPVPVDPR